MTESLGMYGAVDLSSLSAPPAGGGEAASKVRGGVVVDVTAQSMASALDVSAKLPVVLVFYSARSEASVALDSRLQEIAVRRGGRFQLGRVDVDAAVEVAQAFRVTGVPAAVALIQGQPVPLFQGAPADGEIDKVIDQVLARTEPTSASPRSPSNIARRSSPWRPMTSTARRTSSGPP